MVTLLRTVLRDCRTSMFSQPFSRMVKVMHRAADLSNWMNAVLWFAQDPQSTRLWAKISSGHIASSHSRKRIGWSVPAPRWVGRIGHRCRPIPGLPARSISKTRHRCSCGVFQTCICSRPSHLWMIAAANTIYFLLSPGSCLMVRYWWQHLLVGFFALPTLVPSIHRQRWSIHFQAVIMNTQCVLFPS